MPTMVVKLSMVFPSRQVEKRMLPFSKPTANITLPRATALACDVFSGIRMRFFIAILFVFWATGGECPESHVLCGAVGCVLAHHLCERFRRQCPIEAMRLLCADNGNYISRLTVIQFDRPTYSRMQEIWNSSKKIYT
jgi:hypothetical protein